MVKVYAFSRILTKLFMVIFIMVNYKEWDNYILLLVTIMLESLGLIKKMVEEHIIGQENSPTFTKASLREVRGMEEERSGGLMEAGTKANSNREFKVDTDVCSDKEV